MATKKTKPIDKKEYNASNIQALDQHTHLIKRLNLTFGHETGSAENPFSSQKTVGIRELTDNAVDEVQGGYGDRVRVKFFKDGSILVQDNGRGLPVDIGKDANGKPMVGINLCLHLIQSGGKFTSASNSYSSGLNGVGASSLVHLARCTHVKVYRDGYEYSLSFCDGMPGEFADESNPDSKFTEYKDLTKVIKKKDTRPASEKKLYKTGTIIHTWLRDEVFSSKYPVNVDDLIERLRGTAFLIPKLYVEIENELNEIEVSTGKFESQKELFHFEDGIGELVKLNQTKPPIIPNHISIETTSNYTETGVPVLKPNGKVVNEDVQRTICIELALSWDNGYDYNMESYVNTIRTRLGGVHETAFERALVNSFNEKFSSMRGILLKGDENPIFDDFAEGLTVALSVKVSEPQFTSQSKEELGGREVQKAILKGLTQALSEFANANKNAELMKIIGTKVCAAAKARQTRREERDIKRQLNSLAADGDMPIKLADCSITFDENSELYIAEGDSACTALKGARDSTYQAILPIRGKIINALKATKGAVSANIEVQSIIKCLSAGSWDTFDLTKVRYSRVFIATDADADGGAISSLVLILLWMIARPFVEAGRVYQLCTPLFVIKESGKGGKVHYAQDEAEKQSIIKKLERTGKKYNINRLKGLGESPAEVLAETGMNPETRTVKQITIQDIEAAQEMINITMGSDVEPRKNWIEANPMEDLSAIE